MTRVLIIVGSLEVGGTERYVTRIAPLLKARGIHLEICTLERRGPLLDQVRASGVLVHGTSYINRATRSNFITLLKTIAEIRRLVRAGSFDVVHSYLFWADVLGTIGARLAGCSRVIVSRRAMHAWRHDPRPLFHTLELVSNVLAHELIANSRTVLRDTEASERCLPRTRVVIYNGIDVDHYPLAQPGKESVLRLLTVGALSPRKGHEYAIQALKLLREEGIAARLTMVGAGGDESMLRSLVHEADLENCVVFVGQHLDPRPFLVNADLFLLPSRQEGFSNALLEAMASGLAVVATDVGGNAEALVDGEGGILVPPGDPPAIASAVRDLAHDQRRLLAMGTANRNRVSEFFSLEASATRLAEWYRDRRLPR